MSLLFAGESNFKYLMYVNSDISFLFLNSVIVQSDRNTLVSQKNVPTLASCSFDKHGLILIIFGKQYQRILKNDMQCTFNCPYPFTFTYFICF